ncbi:MAG: histidinol dehydrogenase [Amphiplicatus sp.]
MAKRLKSTDPDFDGAFLALVESLREEADDVAAVVAAIIAETRAGGMAALTRLTRNFDRFDLSEENIRVSEAEMAAAEKVCGAADLEALDFAAARIRAYHEKQLPEDHLYTDDMGVTLGWRWTPVDAAGLYAPGGRAAYPSSVLMNAIPALVAGVKRLCLCAPAPEGRFNPLVLAAARRAGVNEVFRVGGAQAIAAMAYGAGPIAPVDIIAGPGNAYVAEAKRQVFGKVGIDSIAGPSEILVVADAANDPQWIAADLLSQAEHDPSSEAILITDDAVFADSVAAAVEAQLKTTARAAIAAEAWRKNSAIIVVETLSQAPALVDRLAPEHLELAVADPAPLLKAVRHAGAIFLGRHAPEAIGDYVAGPDHVLPTARAARYASGLSVLTFMKRASIIGCDEKALAAIGPAAARLADAEGLPSHAQSVRLRLKD